MPLSDLLAQRRPHPADAERNFDAILTPARAAFTQNGDRFGHSPWRQSARRRSRGEAHLGGCMLTSLSPPDRTTRSVPHSRWLTPDAHGKRAEHTR
jgi:hypothetical protein